VCRYLWVESASSLMREVVEVGALVTAPVESTGTVNGGSPVQCIIHSRQGFIPNQATRGFLLQLFSFYMNRTKVVLDNERFLTFPMQYRTGTFQRSAKVWQTVDNQT
jgi:hypothetical protein